VGATFDSDPSAINRLNWILVLIRRKAQGLQQPFLSGAPPMLNRIFPGQFDNTYRGHWLGLWLLIPVMIVKGVQSVDTILLTRLVAEGPDAIPLDNFGAACTETVLSLFALMGMCLLILPLQSIIVLIRYRSMIPFMYLSLLVVSVGSRAIQFVHPLVRSSTLPYGVIMNLAILTVTVVGFVLSLHDKRENAQ